MNLMCNGCGHIYELADAAKSLYDFSPFAYCAVTTTRELQTSHLRRTIEEPSNAPA